MQCKWCKKEYDGTQKMHFWWSSQHKGRSKSGARGAHIGCGYPRLNCVDRSVVCCESDGESLASDVELQNLSAHRDRLLNTYDWQHEDELFLYRTADAVAKEGSR